MVLPAGVADRADTASRTGERRRPDRRTRHAGPFASGLRRIDDDRYEFGSDWIGGYPVAPGLAQPGGVASLVVRDGRLVTQTVASPLPTKMAARSARRARRP